MTHWTEARIKEHLDGTWTKVLFDGRIKTEAVDDGFDPFARTTTTAGRPEGYKAEKPQVAWTPHEDNVLWQGRIRNKPFAEIAWMLDRSENSAKKRWRVLRIRGGVVG